MTLAILDLPPLPTAREMMERALQPHILIGMPHLTPQGLSETWLMKELGHRHWLMLARSMGMANADFRTPDGLEAYAAICATALRHAHLDRAHANDVLTIRSVLSPVSRTQMSSVHRIFAGSLSICEVELISTFVHRLTKGDNHSIARVLLPNNSSAGYAPNMLAKTAADLRAGRLEAHDVSDKAMITSVDFLASGSQEFNGAGLFYFAEFQALMERAYEQSDQAKAARSQIVHREVFFFANAQENEMLRVEINDETADAGPVGCRIFRQDGKMIACGHCLRAAL